MEPDDETDGSVFPAEIGGEDFPIGENFTPHIADGEFYANIVHHQDLA